MYCFLASHAPYLFFMDWPISTVEPRHYEGPRNWQNSFALLRFFFLIILFYYYWGKENHLLYLGLHHVEVHYIEVPLCRGDVELSFLETLPKALS